MTEFRLPKNICDESVYYAINFGGDTRMQEGRFIDEDKTNSHYPTKRVD